MEDRRKADEQDRRKLADRRHVSPATTEHAALERVKELERVLGLAQYELITLNPRLSQPYRGSVTAVLAEIKKALATRSPS